MIRQFELSDMEQVLSIWLDASIKAHNFIAKEFWESKLSAMRDVYLPSAENYVYDEKGIIKGFVSLDYNTLAAIFVLPGIQGKGIGKQLMAKTKTVRNHLNLTVYKENKKSIGFYKKCGFKVLKEQIDEHTGHTELFMVFNS
jgi:putative acetyltransferase